MSHMNKNYRVLAILLSGLSVGFLRADEQTAADPSESTAARLAASTVTVRILPEKVQSAKRPATAAARDQPDASEGVTVCSGVSVAPGQIVTFASNSTTPSITNARVRVTLPDGEQSPAHLRVVDNYSGLSLLDIQERNLPVLEIAADRPKAGSPILSAAAGGIEGPTVSTGIVAGLNRVIGGSILPPLMQCDIRTAETSTGAAVVDKNAKLVGILAVAPAPGDSGGWAFAVSALHVKRLLDARADGKVLILERRPPTLGLRMGPGTADETVKVEHVENEGPADKAGIQPGDLVLEAEGVKVRSAYQVVGMVLNRQAGEKFNFLVQRGDERKSVDVTLGGASERKAIPNVETHPAEQPVQQRSYSGTQMILRPRGNNSYDVINNKLNTIEPAPANGPAAQRNSRNEIDQLRSQVNSLEDTVRELRAELQRQKAAQSASAASSPKNVAAKPAAASTEAASKKQAEPAK